MRNTLREHIENMIRTWREHVRNKGKKKPCQNLKEKKSRHFEQTTWDKVVFHQEEIGEHMQTWASHWENYWEPWGTMVWTRWEDGGNIKHQKKSQTPTPKRKDPSLSKSMLSLLIRLHEISIIKCVCHHFGPRVIPLLKSMGANCYTY
jgi:hypothetical protein